MADADDTERKVIRCPRCKRLLAMLRSFGEYPPGVKSIDELICVPCPVCDGNREGEDAIQKDGEPKKVSRVVCAACGRYLCTIKIFRDFKVEGAGEFLHAANIKCRKCNYENKFTLMVGGQTQSLEG